MIQLSNSFFNNKKILITGHNGFVGSWMCIMLLYLGAEIKGYSLPKDDGISLFDMCSLSQSIESVHGDIRDLYNLKKAVIDYKPDIVIHLAAQSEVFEGYINPVETYGTNIMGTVNLLEAVRHCESVKSLINVTTDKVYLNREWEWGYRESDKLNGYDPYSNSKSCVELISDCFINSYFKSMSQNDNTISISTCRSGNAIGGGDFSNYRLMSDCMQAAIHREPIVVRNPYPIRPYQHVIEQVYLFLLIAQAQFDDSKYAGKYNIGPDEENCWRTGDLVSLFCRAWNRRLEKNEDSYRLQWINECKEEWHESNILKLDCAKVKSIFGWKQVWDVPQIIEYVTEWIECYLHGEDIVICMNKQMMEYLKICKTHMLHEDKVAGSR